MLLMKNLVYVTFMVKQSARVDTLDMEIRKGLEIINHLSFLAFVIWQEDVTEFQIISALQVGPKNKNK